MNEHAKKKNLSGFGWMAMKHWREFLPRKYKNLKEAGTLIQSAYEAQERTKDLVMHLTDKGRMQMHEAQELALPEWILLEAEEEPESALQ